MRILLVSDLHYTLKQMDWVLRASAEYTLVIVAGDHLDAGSFVDHDAQIVVVKEFMRKLATQTRVVVCSGNHDLNVRDANGEKAALWLRGEQSGGVVGDGATLEIDGVLVTVCPYWDGPFGREDLATQLKTVAGERGDKPWVWVYHVPPEDSPTSWTGRNHYGDPDLMRLVREHQPDLVCCGHVHESPFARDGSWAHRIDRTWVLNAGRQRGPIPTHVEIDLGDRTASWWSLEGTEQIALDDDQVVQTS